MMVNKKKLSSYSIAKRITFGLFLVTTITLGVLLLFSDNFQYAKMARGTDEYQVAKQTIETLRKNQKAQVSFDWSTVKPLSGETVATADIDNRKLPVIAGIAIPQLDMNLPIFKGVSEYSLTYGAGTTKENQKIGEGNYGIASHHVFSGWANGFGFDRLLFSPLDKAERGMTVFMTDLENLYAYEIVEKFIVKPDQVDVLDDIPGGSYLTMITCTDAEATQRLVVRAKFLDSTPWNAAPSHVIEAFKRTYNTY